MQNVSDAIVVIWNKIWNKNRRVGCLTVILSVTWDLMCLPLPKRPSIVERLFIKALCSSQVRGCGLPGSPAAIVSGSAGINAALQLASQYYSDLFWPFRALGPPEQELFPSSWRDRQPPPPSLSSIFRTHAASLWTHINPPLAPQSFIKNGLIFELP